VGYIYLAVCAPLFCSPGEIISFWDIHLHIIAKFTLGSERAAAAFSILTTFSLEFVVICGEL